MIATVAVLRLLVLGLCWYLVGVTTIGVVARLLRAARLVRVADALTVAWLRRLLQQGLGVTLAAAMMAGAVGPATGAAGRPAEAVVGEAAGSTQPAELPERAGGPVPPGSLVPPGGLVPPGSLVPPGAVGLGRSTDDGLAPDPQLPAEASVSRLDALPLPVPFGRAPGAAAGDVGTPTGEPELDHESSSGSASTDLQVPWSVAGTSDTGAPSSAGDRSADVRQLAAGADSYVVRSGDSFWRIAEQRVAAQLDRAPTEAELVTYWRTLVEENRGSLPNPDDPDLILPGHRVVLPAVPEA